MEAAVFVCLLKGRLFTKMIKLGAKPAIRNNDVYDSASRAYPRPVRSALRLMRSVRSRNVYDASCHAFRRNPSLLYINEAESEFLSSLLGQGYAIAPGFFSKELIDHIYGRVDTLFQKSFGERADVPAAALSSPPQSIRQERHLRFGRDRTLELAEPLVVIPEILDIVFHESILKIAAHYFRHIPRVYTVSVVRYVPNHQAKCLSKPNAKPDYRRCLSIVIDLVDVDETRGPLVYIPTPENLHLRPNLAQPLSKGVVRCNVSAESPRQTWVILRGERGSIMALPHSGGHGAIWTYPADVNNKPRTSLMIDIRACHHEDPAAEPQNSMLKWNFERLTDLQKMFAYPTFWDEPIPGLAKVS
jgi:hypothetical protein